MFSLNHLKFFIMGDNPSVQKSVLKYYHVDREPNNKGQYIAKCRYCDSKIVGYTHTSTNCLRHIRRVHKDVMSEHEFVPKKKCVQTLQKYTANDAKQQELTDAVLDFIVHQLLPLSVVESDAFKHLMDIADPCFKLPNRKQMSARLLTEEYNNTQRDIIARLRDVDHVSVTLDLWSNRQMRSYIGVTCHYILDWELKSSVLACCKFSGSHTSANIVQQFQDVMAKFELSDKVTCIVTDNASNMIKAFSLPGFEQLHDDGLGMLYSNIFISCIL